MNAKDDPAKNVLIGFPCYMLIRAPFPIDKATGRVVISEQTRFVAVEEPSGVYLLAFTELPFAGRYAKEEGLDPLSAGAFPVESAERLSEIVRNMSRLQGSPLGVLFDPTETFIGWAVTFEQIAQSG